MNSPPVLIPYQARWVADTSQVKVYSKSRRIGITWAEAADGALYSASQEGDDTWYIGYNSDMAREFIEDAGNWARHYDLAASKMEEDVFEHEGLEGKDIQVFRINFASGHKITALSSRPANLRGKQGRVVIDEAAFHPDLPGLLKAALALLMWGGSVRVISTHDGDDNAFNELVQEIRSLRKPYSLHETTIDDALEAGLYERICLRLGRDYSPGAEAKWRAELFDFYGSDADEELLCIPSQGGGTYLPLVLIEKAMQPGLPVIRLEKGNAFASMPDHHREAEVAEWITEELDPVMALLESGLKSFFGMDFGRSGDLSVIAPVQEARDLTRRVPFMVELRNIPFRQQEQILTHLVDGLPNFLAGALDARGNGEYLAERAVQKYGARVAAVMLSQEWYRQEMPPFKAAFEDGMIVIPRDADVKSDLRAIKMEKGIAKVPDSGRGKGTDGKQRHGDAGIALALAHYASRLDVVPIEHQSTGRGRVSSEMQDYLG